MTRSYINSSSTAQPLQSALIDSTSNIKKPTVNGTVRYMKSRYGLEVHRYASENWLTVDVFTTDACQTHEKNFREMLERKRQDERLSSSMYSSEYYKKRWNELLHSYKQDNLTHTEWAKQNYQLICLETLYFRAKTREQRRMDSNVQDVRHSRAENAYVQWKRTKKEKSKQHQNRLNAGQHHQCSTKTTFLQSKNFFPMSTSNTNNDTQITIDDTSYQTSIATYDDNEIRRTSFYQPTISSKHTSTVSSTTTSYTFDEQRWSLQAMLKRIVGLGEPLSPLSKINDRKQSPRTNTSTDSGFESII